ncbi:MAG: DUF4339 domain-containing protein [Verrucomicrobia bacterium]|jgi:hypothetical protein|nr:DUF4339 domain-containing protein [Verrucomicrobiota bacterium]
MEDLIHICHNNQQEGPYSPEQIRTMISSGVIMPASLAWKEGMSDWAPLDTIMSCDTPVTIPASSLPPPVSHTSPESGMVAPDIPTSPKRVGGWLMFFCVGLAILGPLFVLGQMFVTWGQAQPAFDQFQNIRIAVMWENIGSVALLIYGFIAGCMIWGGHPGGREIAKKYLLIRLFGFVGIEFIAIMIMGDMPSQLVARVLGATVGAVFREIIYFLIWWFYFKKSKRVRNTYGVN